MAYVVLPQSVVGIATIALVCSLVADVATVEAQTFIGVLGRPEAEHRLE